MTENNAMLIFLIDITEIFCYFAVATITFNIKIVYVDQSGRHLLIVCLLFLIEITEIFR